ncbi:hypothetical protein SAMN05428949_6475 [Chitinophaga sp. YR627]|uniref:hypothetical protein n=1 Tax=Chitinophaga sp. YR627 TaxID=1881041 RepID=UPI0008E9C38B|nr:hypothetical protein [Chitinophaga sp. YR627]SFO75177.1 hypothetical protein SAMN05428949_6475 [Chitinophaga sp. YR627]
MSLLQKLLTRILPFVITTFASISLVVDMIAKSEALLSKGGLLVLAVSSIAVPFLLEYFVKKGKIVWVFGGHRAVLKSLKPYSHGIGVIFGLMFLAAYFKPLPPDPIKDESIAKQELATVQLIQDLKNTQFKIIGFFKTNNSYVDSSWRPMSMSKRMIQGKSITNDIYGTLRSFFDSMNYKFARPREYEDNQQLYFDRFELISNDANEAVSIKIRTFRKDTGIRIIEYNNFDVYFTDGFFKDFIALNQVNNMNILPGFRDQLEKYIIKREFASIEEVVALGKNFTVFASKRDSVFESDISGDSLIVIYRLPAFRKLNEYLTFSYTLYSESQKLLSSKGIKFDLLKPYDFDGKNAAFLLE